MARPSATARGYGAKWQQARAEFLRANPWCVFCAERGQRVRATCVDHKRPHRGDPRLFWRRSNWQPLCATCHSATKQQLEKSGTLRGCDASGRPLDPAHHWAGGA